jgi:surface antigen
MRSWPLTITLVAAMAALPLAAQARPAMLLPDSSSYADPQTKPAPGIPPGIQCVPYARARSGVQLYGDAHTWWDQAAGRYARGSRPRIGAVMSFPSYGQMQLGHVAAVSKVIDARTVLLSHANWSPIDGRRGQIEEDVKAVDVSPAGDWSEVRVWYAPLGGLGTTHWPVNGFIYNQKPGVPERTAMLASSGAQPVKSRIGADFLKGIVPEGAAKPRLASAARPILASRTMANDPIGRIIASRMR